VLPLPENLSFAEAALTEPFACALHAVDKMRIKPGETIAVIGAGNMARLLVCALKAARACVLVLGRDPGRLRLASAAGADEVIDLTLETDGIAAVGRRTPNDRGADGVIEVVGKPETWALSAGNGPERRSTFAFLSCASGSKAESTPIGFITTKSPSSEFSIIARIMSRQALDLLGQGAVSRDLLIDREISLEEVVLSLPRIPLQAL
jgi:L-iditol 2-dehydrogenase